jgi:hypothetical protein
MGIFRGILLALGCALSYGQASSIHSVVSKRLLCVVHDSTAPEASATETLLDAIQALRYDFIVKYLDVSHHLDGLPAANVLTDSCGLCTDRLVIARAQTLTDSSMHELFQGVPEWCLPPAVRGVLFLMDFLDGLEPSPCLDSPGRLCVLDSSVYIRKDGGHILLHDAIISLAANITAVDRITPQVMLEFGLMPWERHSIDPRMLEAEADLGVLLQRIFRPQIPLHGVTLGFSNRSEGTRGPASAPSPAAWSSWECHPAGLPGYQVPENGPPGADEFCLLQRVTCCTGEEFAFHAGTGSPSPSLPPRRIGSQSSPNLAIAVRASPAAYLVNDCHLHAPVAYLWGHGWEANPGHLLHDAVRLFIVSI